MPSNQEICAKLLSNKYFNSDRIANAKDIKDLPIQFKEVITFKKSIKCYCLSDIHADSEKNQKWVRDHCQRDIADVLEDVFTIFIVPGDIGSELARIESVLQILVRNYDAVCYLPGNHEAWRKGNIGAPAHSSAPSSMGAMTTRRSASTFVSSSTYATVAVNKPMDSVQKLKEVLECAIRCGVYVGPLRVSCSEESKMTTSSANNNSIITDKSTYSRSSRSHKNDNSRKDTITTLAPLSAAIVDTRIPTSNSNSNCTVTVTSPTNTINTINDRDSNSTNHSLHAVVVMPLYGWYHSSWDTEPAITDDQFLSVEEAVPFHGKWGDYNLCHWPEEVLGQIGGEQQREEGKAEVVAVEIDKKRVGNGNIYSTSSNSNSSGNNNSSSSDNNNSSSSGENSCTKVSNYSNSYSSKYVRHSVPLGSAADNSTILAEAFAKLNEPFLYPPPDTTTTIAMASHTTASISATTSSTGSTNAVTTASSSSSTNTTTDDITTDMVMLSNNIKLGSPIIQPGDTIISYSHYLPRIELCPEKRFLSEPMLSTVIGSDPLDCQIQRLQPHIHLYGHTHIPLDLELDNIRYIQWPLGYFREAQLQCGPIHSTGPLLIHHTKNGSGKQGIPVAMPSERTDWSTYYRRNARDVTKTNELAPWLRSRLNGYASFLKNTAATTTASSMSTAAATASTLSTAAATTSTVINKSHTISNHDMKLSDKIGGNSVDIGNSSNKINSPACINPDSSVNSNCTIPFVSDKTRTADTNSCAHSTDSNSTDSKNNSSNSNNNSNNSNNNCNNSNNNSNNNNSFVFNNIIKNTAANNETIITTSISNTGPSSAVNSNIIKNTAANNETIIKTSINNTGPSSAVNSNSIKSTGSNNTGSYSHSRRYNTRSSSNNMISNSINNEAIIGKYSTRSSSTGINHVYNRDITTNNSNIVVGKYSTRSANSDSNSTSTIKPNVNIENSNSNIVTGKYSTRSANSASNSTSSIKPNVSIENNIKNSTIFRCNTTTNNSSSNNSSSNLNNRNNSIDAATSIKYVYQTRSVTAATAAREAAT